MKKRIFSLLLALVLLLGQLPVPIHAAVDQDTNLCQHHTAHDAAVCGYAEGSPAVKCAHGAHADSCYETTCSHVCTEGCERVEGVCTFSCTGAEDCLTSTLTCGHTEDGACCAKAEVTAQPCGYACGICPVQAMIDALPDVEEIKAMTLAEQNEAYDLACDASDVFSDLREDEQALVANAQKLYDLFAYFSEGISLLDDMGESATGRHEHDGIIFLVWNDANALPNTAGNYCLGTDVTIAHNGAETWVAPQGTVNLCLGGNSIFITGNFMSAVSIFVKTGSQLNIWDCMNSGQITGATSSNGQSWPQTGISISGGSVTLNSGNIQKNKDAGVWIGSGSFTMNGGAIKNNATGAYGSHHKGSGLHVAGGTVTIKGGTISSNTGAAGHSGVYVEDGASITLSGSPVIKSNTGGNAPSNLRVSGPIQIGAEGLQSGASVSVSPAQTMTLAENVSREYLNYFSLDSNEYTLIYDEEDRALKAHVHSFQKALNGTNQIVQTCESCDSRETMTLNPPANLEYDGTEKKATVDLTPGFIRDGSLPFTVMYGGRPTDYTAPEDPGNYTATLGKANSGEPFDLSVSFAIKARDLRAEDFEIKLSSGDDTYTGNKKYVQVTCTKSVGDIFISIYDENNTSVGGDRKYPTVTDAGTYQVYVEAGGVNGYPKYTNLYIGTLTIQKAASTVLPDAPTMASVTSASIMLNAVEVKEGALGSVEYAVSTTQEAPGETDSSWQTGTTFTGLNTGTTYYCFARYTGDKNHLPAVSAAAEIKTAVSHIHSWSGWGSDETHHWHECTDDCPVTENSGKDSYGEHTMVDGRCSVCSKQTAFSVTVGDSVSYFDDMNEAFGATTTGTEQSPATIKLLTNVTHTTWKFGAVSKGAYVVLDLNGYTLTFTHKDADIYVEDGSHFTLMDSSDGETGSIVGDYEQPYPTGSELIHVSEQSTMILESGRLVLDMYASEAIQVIETSTLIQNGGVIEGTAYAAVTVCTGSLFTQNGGTIISNGYAVEIEDDGSRYVLEGGTLFLNGNWATGGGGYFNFYESDGPVTINGGVFDAVGASDASISRPTEYMIGRGSYGDCKIIINAATFKNTDNAALYITDGCFDGTITIQFKNVVFENGVALYPGATETLGEYLAPGYVYYDENGNVITLTEGLTELTGKITVAECVHNIEYTSADGHHTAACSVCGLVTEDNVVCTPVIPDADCTTEEKCACGYLIKAAQSSHDFSGTYLSDADGHWHKCVNCDVTDPKAEHSGTDDNNCTTAVLCSSCGYTMTAAKDHTGTDDKLVSDNAGQHDVVWSCCGAVVTENVTCTASNADGSCLTAETCACGNMLIQAKDNHKLTYTASGNVITETCGWTGCEHTATATLHAPENAVYDGTQKLATVTQSEGWAGGALSVGYSGTANDGTRYTAPVKAGEVTAGITAGDAAASVSYTIEKATPEVGTVSVESPASIYPSTALNTIALARTNTTVPGTLALDAGQTLTVGTKACNWTFTPDEPHNYNGVTGKVSITVVEDTLQDIAVTAKPVKTTYTYGEFFDKTGMVVTATYLSGNTADVTAHVIIAPETLTVATTEVTISYQGKTATQALTVNPKVVDNPTVVVDPDSYTYTGAAIKPTTVVVKDGDTVIDDEEYTVAYSNNTNVGKATVTISNKEGGNYDVSGSTTFAITAANLTDVSVVQADTLTYNGAAQTAAVEAKATAANGETVTFTYSTAQTGTYSTAVPAFTGGGSYTVWFKAKAENHAEYTGSFEIVIGKATPAATDFLFTQPGSLIYDGTRKRADVIVRDGVIHMGSVIVRYYDENGNELSGAPTDAGTYTVRIDVTDGSNYIAATNLTDENWTFTIAKAVVTEPTIASKPYNGANQTADVAFSSLYTVQENKGGTDKGSYNVVLALTNSENCRWSSADTPEMTLTFAITKGQNSWTEPPAIESWTYGDPKEPAGAARFGEAAFSWYDSSKALLDAKPVNAGNYFMKASVPADGENYDEIQTDYLPFTIAKAVVTEPAIDGKVYNGQNQRADIADTALYTVETNNGGTASGSYDVVLKLTDSENCKWSGTASDTVTLHFTIRAGENQWTEAPAISGWTYGDPKDPAGEAMFGEAAFAWYDSSKALLDAKPVNAGSYYMKASVPADGNNYAAMATDFLAFTIAKAPLAPAIQLTENSRVYDGTTTVTGASIVLTGAVYNENPMAEAASFAYNSANVAQANKITATGIALTGTWGSNYTLTAATAEIPATITKAWQTAPSAGEGYAIDYAAETITVAENYEVRTARTEGAAVPSGSITGHLGETARTLFIRKAELDNYNASGWTEIPIAARPAAPSLTTRNESIKGIRDGQIIGLDAAMEVSIDGADWTAATSDLSGLPGGTQIKVRVAATKTAPHGAEADCTIAEGRSLTITFDSRGGSTVTAITGLSYNAVVAAPAEPSMEGYTFAGWYTDEACTTAYSFPANVTADITLYAEWEKIIHTITFDPNGGKVHPRSAETGLDGTLRRLPTPEREDYVFEGWYTSRHWGRKVTLRTVFDRDTTIYARWSYRPADSDSPRTGDITHSGLWLTLAAVGLLGLTASLAAKKRCGKRK